MNFLVTAGPTREYIDPVRFISNGSSGKMGVAIANAACQQGHTVTLILGKTLASLSIAPGIHTVSVISAADMFHATRKSFPHTQVLVMVAAVCDYHPKIAQPKKIKKTADTLTLHCVRTPDILTYCSTHKQQGQYLVGFAAETDHLVAHARDKLRIKKLDMIVANDITAPNTGFESPTNTVTILYKNGRKEAFESMEKTVLGTHIADRIIQNFSAIPA